MRSFASRCEPRCLARLAWIPHGRWSGWSGDTILNYAIDVGSLWLALWSRHAQTRSRRRPRRAPPRHPTRQPPSADFLLRRRLRGIPRPDGRVERPKGSGRKSPVFPSGGRAAENRFLRPVPNLLANLLTPISYPNLLPKEWPFEPRAHVEHLVVWPSWKR